MKAPPPPRAGGGVPRANKTGPPPRGPSPGAGLFYARGISGPFLCPRCSEPFFSPSHVGASSISRHDDTRAAISKGVPPAEQSAGGAIQLIHGSLPSRHAEESSGSTPPISLAYVGRRPKKFEIVPQRAMRPKVDTRRQAREFPCGKPCGRRLFMRYTPGLLYRSSFPLVAHFATPIAPTFA